MAELEIPLANSSASPKQVPADFYYRIPVRPIHASYPVYHPDREPPGYFDQLRAKEPIVLWDDKGVRPALTTEADWIAAGKLVFDSPIDSGSGRIAVSMSTNLPVRDPRWYRDVSAPLTPEGILPFYRYVIRERGKVEVGVLSCAMCHTRLMPDGSVISGAQGNFPFGAVFARDFRDGDGLVEINRRLERQLYAAPWLQPDPQAGLGEMSLEQIVASTSNDAWRYLCARTGLAVDAGRLWRPARPWGVSGDFSLSLGEVMHGLMKICYQACNRSPDDIPLATTDLSCKRGLKDLTYRRYAGDEMPKYV